MFLRDRDTTGARSGAATQEQLIRSHMALAHSLVGSFMARLPRSVNRDDLTSAAVSGLAEAATAFDPEKGASFSHFALIRMRGAILDELRAMDWAPRSVRRDARRLEEVTGELAVTLGRNPNRDEVAGKLGMARRGVERLEADLERSSVVNYESLAPSGDAEWALPAVGRNPEEAMLDRELRAYLADGIRRLPERLRRVVVEYFFEERPMQDIADDFGVTESRISQMRAEALALLRDGLNSQLDPDRMRPEAHPNGRLARRKATYYAELAASSGFRQRISAQPVYVPTECAPARSA